MTTTRTYDFLNRLSSVSSAPAAGSAVSFRYLYNDANQRTRVWLADGSLWVYSYDSLGQVVSGKKYWPDWTPVAGQQFVKLMVLVLWYCHVLSKVEVPPFIGFAPPIQQPSLFPDEARPASFVFPVPFNPINSINLLTPKAISFPSKFV